MFEQNAYYVLLAGLLLAIVGFLWLVIRAFRVGMGWGFGCFLFPPLSLVFTAKHWSRARAPFGVLALGLLATAGTIALNRFVVSQLSLGPREKQVDGELHITLTEWDQTDYSILRKRKATVVLQMANADVTDQTLEFLEDMDNLRELDLNGSQVTDAGLEKIADLPALRILRLRGTHVTNEGFLEHLKDKDSLRELDARDTAISSGVLRSWKSEDKENRKYLK